MTGRPLVLLLEDEAIIAMAVEDELVDAGYTVVGPFANCSSALSWLLTNTPDLAVLETRLQDGSCQYLASELRRRGIPFVVYSGAFDTHLPELAEAPWVSKPTQGKALLDAVMHVTTPRDGLSKP